MRVATSEEYRCNPMEIYETWPWELLYDAHQHLNWLDDMRAQHEADAKLAKSGMKR